MTWAVETCTPMDAWILAQYFMAVIDVMPTDTRLVVTPKAEVPRISVMMSSSCCSVAFSGATISTAFSSGIGNALRLIFPLGVMGMLSIFI